MVCRLQERVHIVIPSQVKKEAHLEESDGFLVFGKDDMVLLKKIDKEALEKTFDEVVEPLRKRTEDLGLKDAHEGIVLDHDNV